MRLDNYISKSLNVTRTKSIEIIKKGLIKVNNKIVYKKDYHIDENMDIIAYDNQKLDYKEFVYYMLNKPKGVVSATTDKNDKTVVELINCNKNIFPVGRLDKDTEGLLILTNDGKYAHISTSPKHNIEKKYYVEVLKEISNEDIIRFENGLEIIDGKDQPFITKPSKLCMITNKSCYVTITEGKFHQIKRMFEKIDNKVLYLKRISFGNITLDETLNVGEFRELTTNEIEIFKQK